MALATMIISFIKEQKVELAIMYTLQTRRKQENTILSACVQNWSKINIFVFLDRLLYALFGVIETAIKRGFFFPFFFFFWRGGLV